MASFEEQIKIGQQYYRVLIYPSGCVVEKYINQNSNLDEVVKSSNNWFVTEREAQTVADKINQHFKKLKETK